MRNAFPYHDVMYIHASSEILALYIQQNTKLYDNLPIYCDTLC